MDEINFTTHMITSFLEKYGDLLQGFFINDALLGKYMSAGDLYNYIYPEAKEENYFERVNRIAEEQERELAQKEGRLPEIEEGDYEERTSPIQPMVYRNYKKEMCLVFVR